MFFFPIGFIPPPRIISSPSWTSAPIFRPRSTACLMARRAAVRRLPILDFYLSLVLNGCLESLVARRKSTAYVGHVTQSSKGFTPDRAFVLAITLIFSSRPAVCHFDQQFVISSITCHFERPCHFEQSEKSLIISLPVTQRDSPMVRGRPLAL